MHIYHTIVNRRSLRRYDVREVPRALLEMILDAARWAPSAHNRQPWRFCVVTSITQKDQLARAMGARLYEDLSRDNIGAEARDADVARSYQRLTHAPVLIVVCLSMRDMDHYEDDTRQTHERTMAIQSVAMAGQNMMLAAHEAGLGSCWMCAPLFCADVVQTTLQLPSDWEPQGIIALGYPSQTREKTREALESRVMWR